MQVFGNVASPPERKVSKNTQKGYYEFRLAESQRGPDASTTWYTVRMMLDENPQLNKGDFARVTGKLKTDFYLSREGKPTGTLLIIAFEASKVSCRSVCVGSASVPYRRHHRQLAEPPSGNAALAVKRPGQLACLRGRGVGIVA